MGGMGECSTEFGQYGYAFFESRQFIDRERRTCRNVSADEGGQISRGSQSARLCAPIEGDSVTWPETYRDSVGRRRVLCLRRFGTGGMLRWPKRSTCRWPLLMGGSRQSRRAEVPIPDASF